MIEAINRTVFLRDLKTEDIAKVHKGWRSSHLAGIRALRTEEFGFQSLLFACEKLDVTPVCHFVPSADTTYDGDLARLFKTLHAAGKACETAQPNVGPRSHPLASVSIQTAGLTCYLAIDAIRRSPVFAKREIGEFSAQIEASIDLLRRIPSPSPHVRFAVNRLSEAVKVLESYSIDDDGHSTRHCAESHAAA
ncbi:hypothetical protein GHL01_00335 [Sinorhizobium meliloti]|uniref:hypothetical protein n=1 Tax=Rhizobium meliloti TaxID=382 RepID=UPI001295DF38|nr:hypothetical protein [Sinorhizobium meliloti]MQV12192.1 hypothetical protein [Sinorhizobium meliloti]